VIDVVDGHVVKVGFDCLNLEQTESYTL
jgi:hypothetical protein